MLTPQGSGCRAEIGLFSNKLNVQVILLSLVIKEIKIKKRKNLKQCFTSLHIRKWEGLRRELLGAGGGGGYHTVLTLYNQ